MSGVDEDQTTFLFFISCFSCFKWRLIYLPLYSVWLKVSILRSRQSMWMVYDASCKYGTLQGKSASAQLLKLITREPWVSSLCMTARRRPRLITLQIGSSKLNSMLQTMLWRCSWRTRLICLIAQLNQSAVNNWQMNSDSSSLNVQPNQAQASATCSTRWPGK